MREADGERTVVSHNAAGVAAPADVDLTGAGCLLLDGHHPDLALRAARSARELGMPVVLDAGSWKPVLAELLSYVDVCACSAAFRSRGAADQPGGDPHGRPGPGDVDGRRDERRGRGGADRGRGTPSARATSGTARRRSRWRGWAGCRRRRSVPGVIEYANRAAAVRIGHEGARAWVAPMRGLPREFRRPGGAGVGAAGPGARAARHLRCAGRGQVDAGGPAGGRAGPGGGLRRHGRLPPRAGRTGAAWAAPTARARRTRSTRPAT